LNRPVSSVIGKARRENLGSGKHFRPNAPNYFYVRLTDKTMARLKEVSAELGMPPASTARMILTSTLRDPWLTEYAITPTVFVDEPTKI
jgi:hypothetical protein